ncbi:transmembrane protein [Probopyrinella latreuticola Nege-like virus]|nr:transmembrane protein [Probopyrinella latreuticola Nege-like virus]
MMNILLFSSLTFFACAVTVRREPLYSSLYCEVHGADVPLGPFYSMPRDSVVSRKVPTVHMLSDHPFAVRSFAPLKNFSGVDTGLSKDGVIKEWIEDVDGAYQDPGNKRLKRKKRSDLAKKVVGATKWEAEWAAWTPYGRPTSLVVPEHWYPIMENKSCICLMAEMRGHQVAYDCMGDSKCSAVSVPMELIKNPVYFGDGVVLKKKPRMLTWGVFVHNKRIVRPPPNVYKRYSPVCNRHRGVEIVRVDDVGSEQTYLLIGTYRLCNWILTGGHRLATAEPTLVVLTADVDTTVTIESDCLPEPLSAEVPRRTRAFDKAVGSKPCGFNMDNVRYVNSWIVPIPGTEIKCNALYQKDDRVFRSFDIPVVCGGRTLKCVDRECEQPADACAANFMGSRYYLRGSGLVNYVDKAWTFGWILLAGLALILRSTYFALAAGFCMVWTVAYVSENVRILSIVLMSAGFLSRRITKTKLVLMLWFTYIVMPWARVAGNQVMLPAMAGACVRVSAAKICVIDSWYDYTLDQDVELVDCNVNMRIQTCCWGKWQLCECGDGEDTCEHVKGHDCQLCHLDLLHNGGICWSAQAQNSRKYKYTVSYQPRGNRYDLAFRDHKLKLSFGGRSITVEKGKNYELNGFKFYVDTESLRQPALPRKVYEYSDELWVPHKGYVDTEAGPTECYRDPSGGLVYPKEEWMSEFQTASGVVQPARIAEYFSNDGYFRPLEDVIKSSCTYTRNGTNLRVGHCDTGFYVLNFKKEAVVTNSVAEVTRMGAPDISCFTTGHFMRVSFNIDTKAAGTAIMKTGGGRCWPDVLSLSEGTNHIHVSCEVAEEVRVTVGDKTSTWHPVCDVSRSEMLARNRTVVESIAQSDWLDGLLPSWFYTKVLSWLMGPLSILITIVFAVVAVVLGGYLLLYTGRALAVMWLWMPSRDAPKKN